MVSTTSTVSAEPGWWNNSWDNRRTITISPRNPENFTIKVVIPSDVPKSSYQSIRFLENETSGVLPYWIEKMENNYNTTGADIAWVRRLENYDNTIYMYYGNAAAPKVDNGDNTFLFFDDFGGNANSGKWSAFAEGGTVSFDSTVLHIIGAGGNKPRVEGQFSGLAGQQDWRSTAKNIEFRVKNAGTLRGGMLLNGSGWNQVEYACIFDSSGFKFWQDGNSSAAIVQADKYWIGRVDMYGSSGDNLTTKFYMGNDNADYRTQLWTSDKPKDWTNANGGDYVDKIVLSAWDSGTSSYYFDWIFMRKWAATEPSVNVGSQETVPTAGASISFVPGWNLVCFTAVGATDTPNNLFAPLIYFSDFIIYWWNAPGGPYNVQDGDTAFLDNIAYWVFINTSKTVNTTGFKPDSRTIFTVPGWNMVGFPVVNVSSTPNIKFAPEVYFVDFIIYSWTAPGGPYNVQDGDTAFLENTGYWVFNTITKAVTVP